MPTPLAQWIVAFLTLYAAIGVLFGVVFVIRGVSTVDPGARGAPILFRVLILPGVSALWPLMLRRWVGADRSPTPPSDERAEP